MKMIGHQNEFVQKIRFAAVRVQFFEKKARPRFHVEKRTTFPRVGRDEVGLRIVRCVFACGFQIFPLGLKPGFYSHSCGTTKVVPFQNTPLCKFSAGLTRQPSITARWRSKNSGASAPLLLHKLRLEKDS
jgi:hypothetical protein